MATTLEYDLRGQVCPSTLLTALREINSHQLELKEHRVVLAFHTDNRSATVTVPQAAHNMGLHSEVIKSEQGYLIYVASENV